MLPFPVVAAAGVVGGLIPEDVAPRDSELQAVRTSTDYAGRVMELPVPRTDGEFAQLADVLRALKAFEEQVIAETAEDIELAFRLHRRLCARRDVNLTPIRNARSHVGHIGGDYRVAQERERKRLEDEARRIEMERRRVEAEAAEAAARQAGANEQEVQSVRQDVERAPLTLPAAAVAPPVKVKGMRETRTWTYRVVDQALLPEKYWRREIDHDALKATVKRLAGETNIPGVSVEEVVRTHSSGR